MAWYKTGTISVTNGSPTVTGSGTNFVAGAQVGEGLAAPDGRLYEIQAIVSATSLTLSTNYLGSTQTGQAYQIVPTQSLVANLASQVTALISDFQSVADEAGEGKFDYGTAVSPGITFTLDQDTGFFHDTNNEIGVSAGGTKVAEFNSGGLSFPSGKGVVGNVDFGGSITLSKAISTGITRTDDTGQLIFRGGSAVSGSGANLSLFGASHATLPNFSVFDSDTILFRPVDASPEFLRFVDGTGTIFNETSADLDFRIESDTNTHAFFLRGSDGDVGIGTSSPEGLLHAREDQNGTTRVVIQNRLATGTPVSELTFMTGPVSLSDSRYAYIQSAGSNAAYIAFGTSNSGAPEERMRIGSNGAVSVGTSVGLGQFVSERPASAGWALAGKSAGIANEGGLFFDATNNGELVARNASSTVNVSLKSNGDSFLNGGDVGIGTSSPQTNLHVDAGTKNYTGTAPGLTSYAVSIESGSNGNVGVGIGSHNNIPSIQGFGTGTAYNLALCPAAGNVGIGTSSPVLNLHVTKANSACSIFERSGNDGAVVQLRKDAIIVGSISVTASATAYNTSSDYRLKEDWQPITGASERVLALNPVNFAWKIDGSRVDGFIAHEAQEVVPEAVHGLKDGMQVEEYEISPAVEAVYDEEGNLVSEAVEAVMGTREVPDYQGIDQSKLVPLLTAALQEALTEINNLKARVATLEG